MVDALPKTPDDDEWLPFIRALLDDGLTVPLVVLAFMHYELGHRRGGDAMTSVAAVLGRTREDVLAEVCLACTSPDHAAALTRQLLELPKRLDVMNGLERGVGMIPSAERIEVFWRHAALRNKVAFHRPHAHPAWSRILVLLRGEGFGANELQHAVWRYAVTTDDEGVLPVLRPSLADETVAAAMGVDIEALAPLILQGTQQLAENPESIAERLRQIRTALERIPGVQSVAEEQRVRTPPEVFVPAKGKALVPPWVAFPEGPTSMRWRMGPGEEHMNQWIRFMAQMDSTSRRRYLEANPPSEAWRPWLTRVDESQWAPGAAP